jgi:hypothetical protein
MCHPKDVVDWRPGHPAELPAFDRPGLYSDELTGTRARVSSRLTPFLKQLP